MAKKTESKIELERIYNIPLRKQWLKVPRYRRTKRAITAIKKFLARHMKVEERDIKKVKLNTYLNEEVWFRGIRKPPAKIKVKATKQDGIVRAELLEIPEITKFKIAREEKEKQKAKTEKEKKKPAEKPEEQKEEKTEEQKKEEEEKKEATREAGIEKQKQAAKQEKHIKGAKVQQKHQFRKALQK